MGERLIIGMSGASGAPLAIEVLRQLGERYPEIETHLIVTRGAEMTLRQETKVSLEELMGMAHVCHANSHIGAGPASGSFVSMGMLVVPCSMKTVAGIACGYSDNLLLRAADVTLKERRKLVLAAREAPLSTLHLRNLMELSQMGAVIFPPVPAYYKRPESLAECTRHTAARMLSQFGLGEDCSGWEGMEETNVE